MNVREWCQELRKTKNIRVLCNDWTAFEIEWKKLQEEHERQLFAMDEALMFAKAQLDQLEEFKLDMVDQDVTKALQDEGRLKSALQVEDA